MSHLYPKNQLSSGELDQFLDEHFKKDTIFVRQGNTSFVHLKNTVSY